MGTSSMTTASQSELVGFLQDKDLSKSIKASCGGTCLSSWYFKGRSRMGSLGLGWAAKQKQKTILKEPGVVMCACNLSVSGQQGGRDSRLADYLVQIKTNR